MLSTAFNTARSGLMAQSLRVETAASNIANASSRGPLPDDASNSETSAGLYQPLTVRQSPVITGATAGGGVQATVVPITPAYIAVYEPESSFANEDGMVAAPNVDLAHNMVTLSEAKAAYKANLAVIETVDEMYDALFELFDDHDDDCNCDKG